MSDSSGTGSPRLSQTKGRKTVVVWWCVCVLLLHLQFYCSLCSPHTLSTAISQTSRRPLQRQIQEGFLGSDEPPRVPTTNPPNSSQLDGTPTIPPTYIQVHVVLWKCGEGQTFTQTAVANIHFVSPTPHVKSNGKRQKVKASHTRHGALGPELILVYRQSACR